MYQDGVNFLLNYVAKIGGQYAEWYSGVTNDPEQRLFQDHNVDRMLDPWAHFPCLNAAIARSVEQYLLNIGMTGGSGGGDNQSSQVYVYKITNHSKE